MYDQIATYFEHIFSRCQCGFRMSYSAQHCLLAMIEKWKKVVDDRGVFGALLTDLSIKLLTVFRMISSLPN